MRTNNSHRRSTAGFTLIELMVTIAVGAILATIAVSSYTSQIRKSRRTEARTALLDLASREERFMSTNSVYSDVQADLGYQTTAYPMALGSGYYELKAKPLVDNTANPPTFTITATPVAGKGQDKDAECQSFGINEKGTQTATNATCWK